MIENLESLEELEGTKHSIRLKFPFFIGTVGVFKMVMVLLKNPNASMSVLKFLIEHKRFVAAYLSSEALFSYQNFFYSIRHIKFSNTYIKY